MAAETRHPHRPAGVRRAVPAGAGVPRAGRLRPAHRRPAHPRLPDAGRAVAVDPRPRRHDAGVPVLRAGPHERRPALRRHAGGHRPRLRLRDDVPREAAVRAGELDEVRARAGRGGRRVPLREGGVPRLAGVGRRRVDARRCCRISRRRSLHHDAPAVLGCRAGAWSSAPTRSTRGTSPTRPAGTTGCSSRSPTTRSGASCTATTAATTRRSA